MTRQDSESNLHDALKRYFGFDRFLEGQEQAIQNVCDGRDVVVTMPTGSGKSLCYQLLSMIAEGITIVVSPLISLMKDQVDGLLSRGLPATFINSALSLEEMRERMAGIRSGQYKLVYVAPERFRNQRFMEALAEVQVSLIAVDEAHCISQWGHDFRPDYLRLRRVVEGFPHAQVMALTATATPAVRTDVVLNSAWTRMGEPNRLSLFLVLPDQTFTSLSHGARHMQQSVIGSTPYLLSIQPVSSTVPRGNRPIASLKCSRKMGSTV